MIQEKTIYISPILGLKTILLDKNFLINKKYYKKELKLNKN